MVCVKPCHLRILSNSWVDGGLLRSYSSFASLKVYWREQLEVLVRFIPSLEFSACEICSRRFWKGLGKPSSRTIVAILLHVERKSGSSSALRSELLLEDELLDPDEARIATNVTLDRRENNSKQVSD